MRCDVNDMQPEQLQCRSCSDGTLNGDETCIDGGGNHCREQNRCSDTRRCQFDSDCASGLCHHNVKRVIGGIAAFGDPSAPGGLDETDFQMLQDGGYGAEFTVNEGYGAGYGYGDGEAFENSASTATLALAEEILLALNPNAEEEKWGVCVSCKNRQQDGSETGVDCGERPATNARTTRAASQIQIASRQSAMWTHACAAHSPWMSFCSDGQKTAKTRETDVDCGGACMPCNDAKKCLQDRDCESDSCHMDNVTKVSTCVSCYNNDTDGSESDVDCGGNDYFVLTRQRLRFELRRRLQCRVFPLLRRRFFACYVQRMRSE